MLDWSLQLACAVVARTHRLHVPAAQSHGAQAWHLAKKEQAGMQLLIPCASDEVVAGVSQSTNAHIYSASHTATQTANICVLLRTCLR